MLFISGLVHRIQLHEFQLNVTISMSDIAAAYQSQSKDILLIMFAGVVRFLDVTVHGRFHLIFTGEKIPLKQQQLPT